MPVQRRWLGLLLLVIGLSQALPAQSIFIFPTRRFARGATLPASCQVGDTFFKTTATVGQYNCNTTDTWTAVGGGGGGGATIPATANIIVGDGSGNGANSKVAITSPTTAATLIFGTDNASITFQGTDTYVGRTTTDTLTNKTLTTPKITIINDGNGNPFLLASATASAVDSITVTNAATANPATVTISATGSDTNINLSLVGKGTGGVQFPNGIATGSSPPPLTPGTAGADACGEGTAPSVGPATAVDVWYCDAVQHGILANFNNVGYLPLIQGPASWTTARVVSTNGTNGGKVADAGFLAADVVRSVAPGAGILRVAGSTQVATSAELSGDATTSGSNAVTVAKVNGIAYSATAAAHSVEVVTAANTTATAKTLPDCTDSGGSHLNFTQSTDLFSCGNSSSGSGFTGTSVVSVTPVTATANTTSDQALMELSLSAGYFNSIRQPFIFNAAGVYTTPAAQTPTLNFKIKLCTVSGCGSGTVITLASITSTATLASVTNNNWHMLITAYTAATGATGNFEVHGPLIVDLGTLTTSADSVFVDTNTAVSSNIDLTAALFVDFTVATSTGSASNAITQRVGSVMPDSATAAPVTSFSGDGTLISNSSSTGAITATLATAAAHKAWMNNTGSTATPGYQSIGTADLPAALTNQTSINGVTRPASGTSGGVTCWTSSSVEASSAALAANAVVKGGGAGVCPSGSGIAAPTAAGDATMGQVIAHGATALDFASTATGACATVITATATGAASTDVIIFNANASIKAVTGYVPASTGGFSIAAYPSTNLVSFEGCNWTSGTVDPGSITVNWVVIR